MFTAGEEKLRAESDQTQKARFLTRNLHLILYTYTSSYFTELWCAVYAQGKALPVKIHSAISSANSLGVLTRAVGKAPSSLEGRITR
jgi:hypothetical protein